MKKLLQNKGLLVLVAVVALSVVFASVALAATDAAQVLAVSFNIDIESIMTYAASMFDALMPIAAVGVGLSLGVAIIALLIRVVKGSVSGIG